MWVLFYNFFFFFYKVFWPRDSTIFRNSPGVVLEKSLAIQTLLLTVHKDDIDTRPLPGSFVTFYVDCKFLIIALMVEMGIHNPPGVLKIVNMNGNIFQRYLTPKNFQGCQ